MWRRSVQYRCATIESIRSRHHGTSHKNFATLGYPTCERDLRAFLPCSPRQAACARLWRSAARCRSTCPSHTYGAD